MSKINDGGPAFPVSKDVVYPQLNGMSLRDRAAIEALGGMLAHSTRYKPRPDASPNWHEAICEEAFQIADAFVKAREQSS